MGAAAMIGSALATGLVGLVTSRQLSKQQDNSAAQLQALQNQQQQDALNTMPKAPEAPTNDPNDKANEAEKARQAQLQAMAANEAEVNPTGALGLVNPANTKKKTLGGM